MKKKTILIYILIALLALGSTGYLSYNSGHDKGYTEGVTEGEQQGYTSAKSEAEKEKEYLQSINRAELEKLDVTSDTIYVIGHKSPDADTVISAITWANLLNQLGYHAEARVTEEPDVESRFILEHAGIETPEILYDASGENIFLVDHSEYNQAANGMQDAHIVGIIDHHGVGSVTTGNVVYYHATGIGATATLVWLTYLNYGVEIDQTTANLLLGTVLSDTSNLGSTYTTEADKAAVEYLKPISGIEDTTAYYKEMYAEKLSYKGMSDMDILFSDYKEYESAGKKFGIGLVAAIDEENAAKMSERMREVMPEGLKTRDIDYLLCEVGIREDGVKIDYIVPCDDETSRLIEDCFPDYDEYNGTAFIYRKGLGRKTYLVPGITDFLAAFPHE